MKLSWTKNISVMIGYTNFRSFAIGFHLDKWSANVDFGVFWIGVEW